MRVIGISGLENSADFKRRHFPDLTPRQHHIVQGRDAAAALVTNGAIVAAAAEERFNRIKATTAFPARAIRYCLRQGGITPEDVDVIAHGFDHKPLKFWYDETEYLAEQFRTVYSREAKLDGLHRHFPGIDWSQRLIEVPHHLAHAASAFYPSGFSEALIVVVDGMGESAAATVAIGKDQTIKIIHETFAPHSLGILYGVVTLYLGFWMAMDEYKVMGLAPYGDPRRFHNWFMELIKLRQDGGFSIPILSRGECVAERETFSAVIAALGERLGPPRAEDGAITQDHADVAAGLQKALEDTLLHILCHFASATGLDRLCLAGGVALNCTANGRIRRERLFRDVYIQPASGDDGTALGAALYVQGHGENRPCRMDMPYWGPSFDDDAVAAALAARSCVGVRIHSEADLVNDTAELLANGKIVGWFQGAMEFGPRALGNRSILGDPRDASMRDRINALVKKREAFRPFAPATTAAAAPLYFEIDPDEIHQFFHMLLVAYVRPNMRALLPAVTHLDGTARVQVVTLATNSRFHALLEAFGALTGISVLLNTSFNVRGQPIVCTPDEAVDTFLRQTRCTRNR